MNDQDRERVERIDAIRRFHRTTHPGPCDTCFLLAIIDRERVATREDVERVAQAYCAAYLADPSEGFDRELAGARAALHAMGYTLQDEVKEGMNGVERIAAERKRQIESEGWTPTHDAQHELYELARAAACYAERAFLGPDVTVPRAWPWAEEWWKPGDPIRMLEKAGALIAAEIDRRLACKGKRRSIARALLGEEKVEYCSGDCNEGYGLCSLLHRCMECDTPNGSIIEHRGVPMCVGCAKRVDDEEAPDA